MMIMVYCEWERGTNVLLRDCPSKFIETFKNTMKDGCTDKTVKVQVYHIWCDVLVKIMNMNIPIYITQVY
jgi:hypothetical protein